MALASPARTLAVALALTSRALAEEPAPQPWRAFADPAQAGFSGEKLEEAREHAEESGSAAVVAVTGGHVLAAWGAVDRPLMTHSVRKSLAGALYGIAIAEGRIPAGATLAELGVDDVPPLTPEERQATFSDLVRSRSGVYHPAAYAGSQEAELPPRGSQKPGALFAYNNWDFNAAEGIYEQRTGEDLYQAFDRRIARVLGMEDYAPAAQLEVLEPSRSRFPAHTFRLSARDLARFGLLYLRGGRWGQQQVVPAAWVEESLRIHSPAGKGSGYGQLWWTYEPGSLGENYPVLDRMTVHLARGTGGQTIFLVPGADLVVVHLAEGDEGRSVKGRAIWQLVERIAAARRGEPAAEPALVPVRAVPLGRAPPPAKPATFVALPAEALARFAGEYDLGRGRIGRMFLHEGRLFANLPGYGEAELFATGPRAFTLKVQPGVEVEFGERDGKVTGFRARIGGDRLEGTRRP